jgi:hypothetical protein
LSLGDADVVMLRSMEQSRTEPASRVERARILLGYWKDPSFADLQGDARLARRAARWEVRFHLTLVEEPSAVTASSTNSSPSIGRSLTTG